MVTKEKGNQAQITSYYDPAAVQRLKALSEITRVPQSVYLREALDDLLKKYAGARRKSSSRSSGS
jgi:predicted DNA-binding protein